MDSPIAALSERSQPSLRVRRAKTAAIPAKPLKLLPLPRWVMQAVPRAGGEPLGEPSAGVILSSEVRAGAALFALDEIVRTDPAWLGALRMRLALLATIATARLVRISADEAGLRDAEYLTRPGDDPGPAGRLHRLWRRVAARPAGMAAEIIEALADEVGLKGSTGERQRKWSVSCKPMLIWPCCLGGSNPFHSAPPSSPIPSGERDGSAGFSS